MDYPSSRELLKRAGGKTQRADRWAVLQSENKETIWHGEKNEKAEENKRDIMINAEKRARRQEHGAAEASAAIQTPAPVPYVAGHPNLREPPFPPPQNRHTALDDIWQKHLQALQSAMPAQEWKKGKENQ